MPVFFENGTDGALQMARDAMTSARQAHSVVGIDDGGMTSIVCTLGNPNPHAGLRGGLGGQAGRLHRGRGAAAALHCDLHHQCNILFTSGRIAPSNLP